MRLVLLAINHTHDTLLQPKDTTKCNTFTMFYMPFRSSWEIL